MANQFSKGARPQINQTFPQDVNGEIEKVSGIISTVHYLISIFGGPLGRFLRLAIKFQIHCRRPFEAGRAISMYLLAIDKAHCYLGSECIWGRGIQERYRLMGFLSLVAGELM